jgi:hypothetical protein
MYLPCNIILVIYLDDFLLQEYLKVYCYQWILINTLSKFNSTIPSTSFGLKHAHFFPVIILTYISLSYKCTKCSCTLKVYISIIVKPDRNRSCTVINLDTFVLYPYLPFTGLKVNATSLCGCIGMDVGWTPPAGCKLYYCQSFTIYSLVKVAVPDMASTATLPNGYAFEIPVGHFDLCPLSDKFLIYRH